MVRAVFIFSLFLLWYTPLWAQDVSGPKTLVFTSDADEKIIYQNSPAARAAAEKAAGSSADTKDQTSQEPASPENGLKRLVITPNEGAETGKSTSDDGSTAQKETVPEKQEDPKKEPEKTTLLPRDKLKPWPELQELYAITGTPEQMKRALTAFEGQDGRIPPQGLVYLSGLYESMGDMKQAALYYYAAQLRARFDAKRFGSKGAQAQRQVARLAEMLNPRIGPWVTASSTRLLDTLSAARAWDRETPYHYYPGFGVRAADLAPTPDDLTRNDQAEKSDSTPEIPSESEWPDLLDAVRTDFFRETGRLATALQKMGK